MALLRYWAGARAAAGVEQERVAADTLQEALDAACAGRDERFTTIIGVCTFVVDEQPVGRTPPAQVSLPPEAVVEVLPPFAGGAGEADALAAITAGRHLPRWWTPLLGAAASTLVLGGAVAGEGWLWGAVIALQLVLALTWHRALGAPAAASGALVGAGLTAIVDVLVATSEADAGLGPVAVVLGAGYLAAVAQQLARRDGREHLVDALAATVSLATVAALGAAWMVVWRLSDGEELAVVLAASAVAAAFGRLAPGVGGALAGPVVAAGAAGAALGVSVDVVGLALGVALGVAAGVPAALGAAMQAQVRGDGRGWLPGAVWPVLLAAPLGYVVVRLLG